MLVLPEVTITQSNVVRIKYNCHKSSENLNIVSNTSLLKLSAKSPNYWEPKQMDAENYQ